MTTVRIADITNQIRGVSYKPSDVKDGQINGAKPILRANNITPDGLVFDDLVWIDEKVISKQQFLQKFDIVIAASSGSKSVIGKASQLGQSWEGSFGAFCKVLRPKIEKVDPKYLYYFFQTKEYRTTVSALAAGANINNLRNEHLDNLQIPLPPLPIQKKIAAILDKADSLRQKDKQLLEYYNKLAQSIFYDMFGDPVRNEKRWSTKSLAESSERVQIGPFGNLLHEADYVHNGIPLVNPKHIIAGRIVPDHKQTVTKAKYESLPMYSLRKDDLIMGRRGEMGRCAIVSELEHGWLCGTGSLFIRPNSKINSTFLFYVMSSQSIKAWLEHESIGTTLPNLNATIVNKLSIPIPSINLQHRFESAIQKVSLAKTHCNEVAALSDKLFRDLLQKAFKGELVKEP